MILALAQLLSLCDTGLHPAPHSHQFLLLQALDLPAVMKKVGFSLPEVISIANFQASVENTWEDVQILLHILGISPLKVIFKAIGTLHS